MNKVLNEALLAIRSERDGDFDKSFDLVDQLVDEYGENSLAERLYEDISCEWSWEVVADLFSILIWSTNDNGSALVAVTQSWLEQGDDLRKIQIALNLDCYPFRDGEKMNEVLARIAKCHPEVSARCNELISSREKVI